MSNPEWRVDLEEKEELLRTCTAPEGHTVPKGLLDDSAFRSYFIKSCERSNITVLGRQLPLYHDFIGSCGSIIGISNEIGIHASYNGRPKSLVRKISLAALEVGRRHGAGFDAVVDLQVALHKTVPTLDRLDRWSHSDQVQEALNGIYGIFIKFYMDVIKAYITKTSDTKQNLLSDQAFKNIIKEAGNAFSNAKDNYDQSVKRAEQSEAASSSGNGVMSFQVPTTFEFEFRNPKEIGEGAHGKVYQVEEKSTQELYACKDIQMSKPALRGKDKSDVKGEILRLKKLHHPHIVKISAYSQTENGFQILMEPLADYDLMKFLTDCAEEGFPSNKTKIILPWFSCLLHALNFTHLEKIKHRDIKPANILIKESRVFLSDFSLAVDFGQDTSVAEDELPAGTLRYRAPETKNNQPGGRKADVFSLGCVYSEMLTVFCRKPLEDFCNRRKAEHKTDRFRDGLPVVLKWLAKLRKASPQDENVKAMCRTIRQMIEEHPDDRLLADEALGSIAGISNLSCVHIH